MNRAIRITVGTALIIATVAAVQTCWAPDSTESTTSAYLAIFWTF